MVLQYVHFMSLARWAGVLYGAPFAWARNWLQRRSGMYQRVVLWHAFDIARAHYAAGVHAGLIERSLLASGAFERRLGVLERLTLGPWARRV